MNTHTPTHACIAPPDLHACKHICVSTSTTPCECATPNPLHDCVRACAHTCYVHVHGYTHAHASPCRQDVMQLGTPRGCQRHVSHWQPNRTQGGSSATSSSSSWQRFSMTQAMTCRRRRRSRCLPRVCPVVAPQRVQHHNAGNTSNCIASRHHTTHVPRMCQCLHVHLPACRWCMAWPACCAWLTPVLWCW